VGGVPKHPTRKIHDAPPAYEFDGPVKGSYPHWYDPSYWNEGIKVEFNLTIPLKRVFKHLYQYYELLIGFPGAIMLGLFLLLYMGCERRSSITRIVAAWPILCPAVVGMMLFLPLHMENRFIAPWFTIGLLVLFVGVRISDTRLVYGIITCFLLTFALVMGPLAARDATLAVRGAFVDPLSTGNGFLALRSRTQRNVYWEVANGLRSMGLVAGDKVASTSYANRNNAAWARLARAQIIAEVYDAPLDGSPGEVNDAFWVADRATKENILSTFRAAGAKVVVADSIPHWVRKPIGWRRIAKTEYFAYFFQDHKPGDSV
jgi:hypothetical protein